MICKPCRQRNHGACLTLYPPFPGGTEEWKPRDEVSPTWCDCQHKPDDFLAAIQHHERQMQHSLAAAELTRLPVIGQGF